MKDVHCGFQLYNTLFRKSKHIRASNGLVVTQMAKQRLNRLSLDF